MAPSEHEGEAVVPAEPDIEFSPLGGLVTRDERTVQLMIFRIAGSDRGWAMEVVDINNTTTRKMTATSKTKATAGGL